MVCTCRVWRAMLADLVPPEDLAHEATTETEELPVTPEHRGSPEWADHRVDLDQS